MESEQQSPARGKRGAGASPPALRIAVVDDDERVRRLLRSVFESGGYSVSEARDATELKSVLKRHTISLITLDLSLRHEDGLAIARSVRASSAVPIIMVTARSEDIDRIVGLEIGADDYIVKPFNVREVLARVRAVLRRTSAGPFGSDARDSDLVRFSGFVIDRAARELRTAAGRVVATTTAEFNVLDAFASHAGRVLSRDTLIDLSGGAAAAPLERSIDTLVGRLRQKIESDRRAPQIIKTVRGAGYIFTAKLRGK